MNCLHLTAVLPFLFVFFLICIIPSFFFPPQHLILYLAYFIVASIFASVASSIPSSSSSSSSSSKTLVGLLDFGDEDEARLRETSVVRRERAEVGDFDPNPARLPEIGAPPRVADEEVPAAPTIELLAAALRLPKL